MCYFLKKSKLSLPKFHNEQNIKVLHKDFPGGPVVGTSPSNAGGVGSIPGLGAHLPHGQKNETSDKNSIVTSLIKTFKMVHIKKKFFLIIN